MKKFFLIVLFFFIIPGIALASDYEYSGTKSGVKGKIIVKTAGGDKVLSKIVYKQKIGSKVKHFTYKNKNYVAVVPRKKTSKRRYFKVYRFYRNQMKLELAARKKIGTNKSKFKFAISANEITLKRHGDSTIYRQYKFKPQKKKLVRFVDQQNINLGLGELYPVWGTAFDAQIPSNRPSWAMAMAMTTELIGERNVDLGINDMFGIAVKESKLGCDVNAEGVTYVPAAAAEGCFQFQGIGTNTAWEEMQQIFPVRFASQNYSDLGPGDKFETSAILVAYYFNFTRGMFDHWSWNIDGFISGAADPEANTKIYALAYNRGLWDADLENILKNNRTACLAESNLDDCISNAGGKDYAQSISNYSDTLENSADVYQTDMTWEDIEYFINRIEILYPNTDFTKLEKRTRNVFNFIDTNKEINFQEDFYSVLYIVLDNLPDFPDPENKINEYY